MTTSRPVTMMAAMFAVSAAAGLAQQPAAPPGGPAAKPMTLSSTAFADGAEIPVKYTQAGDQKSPALAWTNVPPNAASLVLHVHDLEVARNRTSDDQVHWLVWNIPPSSTGLPEGVPQGADLPDGSHQISASGAVYRGPGAPASGPLHHYLFELYALDIRLDVPSATDAFETRSAVFKAMQGHVVGKAVYMGRFRRPQ